ncbi:hypothetical protein ABZ153_05600 [Streptomyces sp. NPDC006290]|uniref:hypothetical protein n=1 Tax=Streptomyces sp. NPDC006290 TaxID=3156745 RepID=UPI0033B80304
MLRAAELTDLAHRLAEERPAGERMPSERRPSPGAGSLVLREAARALQPGGRFVHLGVHPCFIGAFADWSERPRIVVDERYADRSRSFAAWNPAGAWHLPLADLLNATTAAGLRLVRTAEAGPGGVPDLFDLLAVKN